MGLFGGGGFKISAPKIKISAPKIGNPFKEIEKAGSDILGGTGDALKDLTKGHAIGGAQHVGGKIKSARASRAGFDKEELAGFMTQAGSLASSTSRVDADAEGFGPQFTRRKGDQVHTLNTTISKDQVAAMISGFKQRQDEVFGRRARPGVVAQSRLV